MTAPNDAEFDYLPIASGSQLEAGDSVVFAFGFQLTVEDITSVEVEGGTRYSFIDTTDSMQADVDYPDNGLMPYRTTQYIVTAHPTAGTKFTNSDGSRWIVQEAGAYLCYAPGSTYPEGIVLTRALIVGSMFEAS